MVPVPEGKIVMRDDRINREWEMWIRPFLMGCYPVTQDQYRAVNSINPSAFRAGLRPVESVSWMEAVHFCNRVSALAGIRPYYQIEPDNNAVSVNETSDGYRLPTEAEWEYGCKAGKPGPRYGNIDDIAWYRKNSSGSTQPVGLKTPNAWGLYDMLGNVWEWCHDLYDEEIYGSFRIIRGGGWNDTERGCLATNRRRSHPLAFRMDDLGFRLARNVSSENR